MKKGSLAFIFVILVGLFTMTSLTSVDASETTVDDRAGLFTQEQIQQLNQAATTIEEKSKASVFIVTTNDSNEDPYTFADYYLLDTIGKNENGIIFYIDMNNREFVISKSGNMIDYLNDSRTENTLDEIGSFMGDQNYFGAARSYLDNVSAYFDQGVPKGHYRIDTETGKITYYKVLTPVEILIAVLAAAAITIGFIVIAISKYRLKLGADYTYPVNENGSIHLTEKEDRLINSFVTSRPLPRNPPSNGGSGGGGGSSTHTTGGGTFSSSGRSF